MRSNRRLFVATLLSGLVLGAGVTYWYTEPFRVSAQERVAVSFKPEEQATLASLESALTRIADTVTPSVVHIRAKKNITIENPTRRWRIPPPEGNDEENNNSNPRLFQVPPNNDENFREFFRQFQVPDTDTPRRVEGQGSGVIIRSDGYILTNDHVVSGADEVEVVFKDGRTAKGKVLRDQRTDLAVVKVELNNLPAATLGDSTEVKPGQIVFAIGSPFGLNHSLTMGIVSALGRQEIIGGGSETRFYPELIQTDASINQGNSGGPLVNSRGEVVGVNTAIVAGQYGGNVGVGFAIPINRARSVVTQLIERGKVERGYLGVLPEDLTGDLKESLNIQNGAIIRRVEQGTPAWNAGLRAGDVVTKFDGKTVKNQIDLRDRISETPPGRKIEIEAMRDGKKMTFDATLGSPEEQLAQAEPEKEQPARKIGINVGELSDKNKRDMQTNKGVVVTSVDPNSSAASAGLQRNDVVRSVNGKAVATPEEFNEAFTAIKSGEIARLVVVRREGNRIAEEMITFRAP